MGSHTLFVDDLPYSTSPKDLWLLFGEDGMVDHVFISRKKRRNKDKMFGFVRFINPADANRAVNKLHGSPFMDGKISVSWAKYRKDGDRFKPRERYKYRVKRRYSDALLGKQRWDISISEDKTSPVLSSLKVPDNMDISNSDELSNGKDPNSSPEPKTNTLPNLLTTQEPVNTMPANDLRQPMLVENGERIDTSRTATDLHSTDKAVNSECLKEGTTAEDFLENDSQCTDGDGLRDVSNKLDVGEA